MSEKDKNRFPSSIISFRVSPEERLQIETRIKVCGIPKGEYFINSLLHQKNVISVGKYKSDRLSMELKRLRETLENMKKTDEIENILEECKFLLTELLAITRENDITAENFKTMKKS